MKNLLSSTGADAVKKDDNTDDCGDDEPCRVESKPGEVKCCRESVSIGNGIEVSDELTDIFAEISANTIKRLGLVPHTGASPLVTEDSALAGQLADWSVVMRLSRAVVQGEGIQVEALG